MVRPAKQHALINEYALINEMCLITRKYGMSKLHDNADARHAQGMCSKSSSSDHFRSQNFCVRKFCVTIIILVYIKHAPYFRDLL